MDLPKLIALDLDGTLLPASKRLTSRSLDVLQRMEALGVEITLATGKFLHLTQRYADDLGLTAPVIAMDGARVGGNGNGLWEKGIPRATVVSLLERYWQPGRSVFGDNGADELLLHAGTSELLDVVRVWAERVRRVDDLREHLVADPTILCMYGPRSVMEAIRGEVEERHPRLRVSLYDSEWMKETRISFQPGGVSKGSGLSTLLPTLGLAPEECIVFGDWRNDLPMFEVGCVNVAMANAAPEVKARAHHITDHSCEEDGVARFLEARFL